MTNVNRYTMGEIYLFHFSRPIGNTANRHGSAQHYAGWALFAEKRIHEHLTGYSGVAIIAAARAAGVELIPYVLGTAPKDTEWIMKNRTKKSLALYCPACCAAAGRTPRALPMPPALEQVDDDSWFDAALADVERRPRADWLEIEQLKTWRAGRAGLILPPSALADDDRSII